LKHSGLLTGMNSCHQMQTIFGSLWFFASA
jgi:hypothetical protein